jgi:MFS family permease
MTHRIVVRLAVAGRRTRPTRRGRVVACRLTQRPASLWRVAGFRAFWAGETISLFGTEISALAIPVAATLVLHASGAQVSLLAACSWAPYACSVCFGPWVDRHRRRTVLLLTNGGRAVLLALVPVSYALHLLSFGLLASIALLTGILSALFLLAYNAFLPTMVPPSLLLRGNQAMELSLSAAKVGGPGLAGLLVQVVAAPLAVALDAVSYLCSAALLVRLPVREPRPTEPTGAFWPALRASVRITFQDRILRSYMGYAAVLNGCEQMILALLVVFAIRELHLPPAALGSAMAVGSIGALLGAANVGWVARRLGREATMIGGALMNTLAFFLIGLVRGSLVSEIVMLVAAFLLIGAGQASSSVLLKATRQERVPVQVLGRVMAAYTTVVLGAVPVGALLAAGLQLVIGLRATIVCGAVLSLGTLWWLAPLLAYQHQDLPVFRVASEASRAVAPVASDATPVSEPIPIAS